MRHVRRRPARVEDRPYHHGAAAAGDGRHDAPERGGDDHGTRPTRADVRAKLANVAIVLQHCGSAQTAAVLAEELRELADAGYAVVTISELLARIFQ